MLPSPSLTVEEVHLVACLTKISHNFFPPGRSVVISSPSTYRDVQQELIAEVHRTAIWPAVVILDGEISETNKKDFIDKDGSYIILIPDGSFKNFQFQINGLTQEGEFEFTRFWNSEARFVVAGTNEFSVLQQTDIFDYLSKFRIYNCIIVSREHYIIDREYRKPINDKDIDTGMKLGVYTWFPYQSSVHCTEVNDITLLDSWVISAQGHFTKKTDLFPIKIRNSFNGCPMKAVVREVRQFVETFYVNGKVTNGSDIRDWELGLLKMIVQHMNMTFVRVPTPEDFALEPGLLNSLFTAMTAKEVNIVVGGVKRSLWYYSSFDLTNSYHTTYFRWYVPCSIKYPRLTRIFRIMSAELWLVLMVSILIVAILSTIVGRYSYTSEWQSYKTLTSSLTNVWAVILGVAVSTTPRAPSLRSLFLAWLWFSLVFSTVFQAFLTTFLIDPGYEPPIQNIDELFASGIKLAYDPGFTFIVEVGEETEKSNIQKNGVNCSSYLDCLDWAMYYKNVSIMLFDIEFEIRNAIDGYLGVKSKPLLCRLEDGVLFPASYTMMMFHGDPLMRRVNRIVDRVFESGVYNHWISSHVSSQRILFRKENIAQSLDGYYSFNLHHMQPSFYLLLMGWCLSALCFVVEVLYNRILSKIM